VPLHCLCEQVLVLLPLESVGCVLQAASERAIAVPQDLSVAGFDDIDLAAHVVPPLTTVHVGGDAAGRSAAELLFRRLNEPDAPVQQITVATQMVVRKSSGPLRT